MLPAEVFVKTVNGIFEGILNVPSGTLSPWLYSLFIKSPDTFQHIGIPGRIFGQMVANVACRRWGEECLAFVTNSHDAARRERKQTVALHSIYK